MIGGTLGTTTLALGVDALVGDPAFMPHPVRLIGSTIHAVDQKANHSDLGPSRLRWRGLALALVIPIASIAATWALVRIATTLWPVLGYALAIWLTSTTIACKGLYQAGQAVLDPLRHKDLQAARHATSMIVGRDTANLSESEVVRATVETLAENLVDGVVAPVFYAVLGGAPLAMAYRSINTLDSMVGYKNPRYQDFGWASARLDDFANYIPARITAVLLFLVMAALRLSPLRAWQTMRHDAAKHPSPNAGIPESMMAGGLGVQLGGTNLYGGRISHRALMGAPIHALSLDQINLALRVVIGTGALLLVLIGIGWVARL